MLIAESASSICAIATKRLCKWSRRRKTQEEHEGQGLEDDSESWESKKLASAK